MLNPEEIYSQYSKRIFNLAYRMIGNKEDAADITQDTFIQAFNNISKFKGESQIYTWVYTIAKNNCLKFLKNKKRSTFQEFEILIERSSSSFLDENSEEDKSKYILQVKDGCLSGLLRCLSLQQRLAFILNILLNIPVKDVAIVMDNSENATRILVHRAKQNLKEFLCNNCSIYDSANPCRCENLINFSLKQNWISKHHQISPSKIEDEIKDIKNVFKLYKTLSEETPYTHASDIKQLIRQKQQSIIFASKKVK